MYIVSPISAPYPDVRLVKIVVGVVAGMYTVFGIVQLIGVLMAADKNGLPNITAAIAVPCLGAAISLGCLQSAFAKPKTKPQDQSDDSDAD